MKDEGWIEEEDRADDGDKTGAIRSPGSSLCPYPSKCPISCITTSSRSTPGIGDR